jgi:hypothetical protein
MKHPRPISVVLLIVFSLSVLSGCMIARLRQTKKNMCDLDSNFSYATDDGFELLFKHPTLLYNDIITLTGSNPSEVIQREEKRIARYIFVRKSPEAEENNKVVFTYTFSVVDGEYKLTKYHLDRNITGIFTKELMMHFLKAGCTLKIKGRSGTVIFGDNVVEALPHIDTLKDILGEPETETDHSLTYYYYLKNSKTDNKYRIEVVFDKTNGEIIRVNSEYLRYELNVDFDERIAVARVRNYMDFVWLSLNVGFSL